MANGERNDDATAPTTPPVRRGGAGKRLLARLALLLGAFAFALLLVEVGMRLAGHGPGTHLRWFEHDDLHYTAAPNQDGIVRVQDAAAGDRTIRVHINSYGQRCEDYPLEKQPGETRVVALGDSLTFGPGVGNSETFVLQAEAELNRTQPEGRFVRIVNTAANGYSTWHYKQWMETQLGTYEPDLVVLCLYMGNDMTIQERTRLFNPTPFPSIVRTTAIGHWFLANHRQALMDLWEWLEGGEDVPRLLEPIDPKLRRFLNVSEDRLGYDAKIRLWQNSLRHVARMKEIADETGTPFVCFLIPQSHMMQKDGDYPIQGWLVRALEALGIQVVQPDDALRPLGLSGWHDYDPGHLNPAGHEAAGRAFAAGLRELGHLP